MVFQHTLQSGNKVNAWINPDNDGHPGMVNCGRVLEEDQEDQEEFQQWKDTVVFPALRERVESLYK
jgi:hypothetical protein